MGSGKTTIGRILANVLGYTFLDLDEQIEESAQMTIPHIFTQFGEAHFRKIERDALEKTQNLTQTIIGLGGGVLANEQNLKWVLQHGLSVYLKVSAHELAIRLQHATNRPLLYGDNGALLPLEALQSRIEHILSQRQAFYEQAHIVIPIENLSIGQSVDLVSTTIRKHGAG